MDTVGKRLSLLIKELNITAEKFALEVGKDKGSISKWINKGVNPSSDVLIKIGEKYKNANINWLLTGKGDILLNTDYQVPAEGNHNIEESISNFNIKTMTPEVDYLRKQIDLLMLTVQDQAASIRDYAAAEKENARSRANLTDTVIVQAHTISNLTSRTTTKNGTVGD